MNDIVTPGYFTVDRTARTIRGLLMPWNEQSRTASAVGVTTAPVAFKPGALTVPPDLSVLNANIDHKQTQPVARFVGTESLPAGLVANFAISTNPDGIAFLDEYDENARTGKPQRKLSAEVRDIVRDASGLFATAVLTGAAFVAEGAFQSAGLFAIDAAGDTGGLEDDPETEDLIIPVVPVDGVIEIIASELPDTVTVTVDETTTIYTPDNTEQEETLPDAIAPTAAFNIRREATPVEAAGVRQISEALALFAARGDRSLIDAIAESEQPRGNTGMFALNDIKSTTAGSVGATLIQPQWLGTLWAGREYVRRIIPLMGHGDLKSFKVTGFRWGVKPEMGAWAGNKTAIPTNTPSVLPYSVDAQRFAGGHDIDRAFRDFDAPEFWDAYFKAMTESYAKLSDDAALKEIIAGARFVEAGDVPAGVNTGLVSIVDGALAVLPKGVPSYAIVAPDIYRSIALTKEIDKLAFLNTALGLEEGTVENFRVVPHPDMTPGSTLVGIQGASTAFELPGAPIRTEALDQIKGGIDEALYGYSATVINEPAALALVMPSGATDPRIVTP